MEGKARLLILPPVVGLLFIISLALAAPSGSVSDSPIKVVSSGQQWNTLKATGEESVFKPIFADIKDKKTDICFVLRDGISPSSADLTTKTIYSQNGQPILDNKGKTMTIKYETAKCNDNGIMKDGYHLLLTDAASVNIDNFIQLGSNSIALIYQDINTVEFMGNTNATLYKRISGNWDNTVNSVTVYQEGDNFVFKANDSHALGMSLYRYEVTSIDPIIQRRNKLYVDGYEINFDGVCNAYYTDNGGFSAGCSIDFNKTANKITVTFLSNGTIDPTYIYTTSGYPAYAINVTQEPNNWTHIPVNMTSTMGYWNFDLDDINTTSYDFTTNGNDGDYGITGWTKVNCPYGQQCAFSNGSYNSAKITVSNAPSLNIGGVKYQWDCPFCGPAYPVAYTTPTNFSLEIWMTVGNQTTASGQNVFWGKSAAGAGANLYGLNAYLDNNQKLHLMIRQWQLDEDSYYGCEAMGDTAMTIGQLQSVVITVRRNASCDTGNFDFYLDGTAMSKTMIDTTGRSDTVPATTYSAELSTLYMLADIGTRMFNGTIDEVRAMNSSLTATDASNWNANSTLTNKYIITEQNNVTFAPIQVATGNNTANISIMKLYTNSSIMNVSLTIGEWDRARGYLNNNSAPWFYNGTSPLVSGASIYKLMHWYRFDENPYTGLKFEVNDSVPNEMINGTAVNGATINFSGLYGNASQFDGIDDYHNITDNTTTTYDMASSSVMVFAQFLSMNSTANQTIVANGNYSAPTNTPAGWAVQYADQKVCFVYGSSPNRVCTTKTYSTGLWHDVFFIHTASSTVLNLWVDGNLEITTNAPVTYLPKHQVWIGALMKGDGTPMNYFNGSIDNVVFWYNTNVGFYPSPSQLHAQFVANWSYTQPYVNVTQTYTNSTFTKNVSTELLSIIAKETTTNSFWSPYMSIWNSTISLADNPCLPTYGDWNLPCSCTISSPITVPANMNIISAGKLIINSIITLKKGYSVGMVAGCDVTTKAGTGFEAV